MSSSRPLAGPRSPRSSFTSPPAFGNRAWSTSDPAAIVLVTLMPALFPGPADLLPTAPVSVASGFNIVDSFQSLTGRDISEGDVDAAFAYQVGSNFVDGSVVLQAAGGDGNVAIFRLNPSRGERNVMGQFELASAPGAAQVPEPSSVELRAAAGLLLAAWRMAVWRTQ